MQSNFTKIGEHKIHYVKAGTGRHHVILLHGWGISHANYEAMIQELALKGYSVYALDLPGFGKSPEPVLPWGFEEYEQLVTEFVKQQKITGYSIAGHSFGGGIALLHASKNPYNLKTLILLAARTIVHPLTSRQKLARAMAKIGKLIFKIPGLKHIKQKAKEQLYKAAGTKDYLQASEKMKKVMKNIITTDLQRHLSSVTIPTLIMWGSEDHSTPLSDAHTLHTKIPNSELFILDHANHALPYKNWDEIKEPLLTFLEKHV